MEATITTNDIAGGEKTTAWILLGVAIAANAAGYLLHWFGRIAGVVAAAMARD